MTKTPALLFSLIAMIAVSWSALAAAQDAEVVPSEISFAKSSTVRFASLEEGKKRIGTSDSFTKSMSAMDRKLRMKSEKDQGEKAFLKMAQGEVREWSTAEKAKLVAAFEAASKKLVEKKFKLSIPKSILVIKMTGYESIGPGTHYTRGNAIMFSMGPAFQSLEMLTSLVLHELFHVLSRHDTKLRAKLYPLIGFDACKAVNLKAVLGDRLISNPDAYHHEYAMEVNYQEKKAFILPVLVAKSDVYSGGPFFSYMRVQLLVLDKAEGKLIPRKEGDKPLLVGIGAVPDYLKKLGGNTDYIIHPEEVMADNFTLAVTGKGAKNQKIIEGIHKALKK